MPSLPSDDNNASSQLHTTLVDSITHALSTRKPLLTHLNADTTWLLCIPYPKTTASRSGRRYFHILIDPWLRGGQSDVAKFFSQQWHAQESAVQSISEVENLIKGVEEAARDRLSPSGDTIVVDDGSEGMDWETSNEKEADKDNHNGESWIDAVVVSHEFTDHMHKDTLLEITPSVPIFAATKAASAIRSWRHFDFVSEIPRFGGDWRTSSTKPLPEWIGISRVAYPGNDLLYYHSAVMIAFSGDANEDAEAVIYTPHGISPADMAPVSKAKPSIKTLALLHGLQDISLGAQLNMGAHNGLKVHRLLGAKYWIGTHDEVKKGGGDGEGEGGDGEWGGGKGWCVGEFGGSEV
ncbi:hypothetical protein G7Y89_g15734 [Cudoniella acicularis]|uniref:Uncharacterized protein n=1 Tax=Cudoniella acicularis TaxID=354080 RepID=A0A8H4QGN8_9HELO|nr:hypothetical protein G7Y89_g15734 [Cudoniella acicularis]